MPIPGTTKLNRLEENIGATAVELTPDDLREIDSAASKIKVEGARYPERLETNDRLVRGAHSWEPLSFAGETATPNYSFPS